MDEYIRELQVQGAIQEPNVSSVMEELVSNRAVPTMEDAELKGELRKLNKNLSQIINLKKQANMMVGGFYCFIIAIYLLFI